MKQRTIFAYGYEVTGNDEIISEIENTIPDKSQCINWYNFKSGDFYWSDNGNKYVVFVDHDEKTVILKEG